MVTLATNMNDDVGQTCEASGVSDCIATMSPPPCRCDAESGSTAVNSLLQRRTDALALSATEDAIRAFLVSTLNVDSGKRSALTAASGSGASELGGIFGGSVCLRSCPLACSALTFNPLDVTTLDAIVRPSTVALGAMSSVLCRSTLVTA